MPAHCAWWSIVALAVARLTATSVTPGTSLSANSTRRTQAAQVIPPTETVVFRAFSVDNLKPRFLYLLPDLQFGRRASPR